MRPLILLLLAALTACGDGGSAALYARERALPPECKAGKITLEQAKKLIGYHLPTVAVQVAEGDALEHNTRRDKVTGIIRFVFVRGEITRLAVAHELAHAAVFDAYSNHAAPGQPSTEKSVDVHGDEFVKAYKSFIVALVSKDCAGAL